MFKNIPTFVVNLKRSTERRKYIENHLKSKNIQYELIEAVDGKTLTQEQIKAVTGKKGFIELQQLNQEFCSNNNKELITMTKSTIGCALSHIKIFKRIVNEAIPYALILEDDAMIEDGIDNDFLDSLPMNWDVLLLGYRLNHDVPPDPVPCSFWGRYKKNNFVMAKPVRKRMVYCTHGYIVSQQGAKRLLKLTHPLEKPIDHLTGDRSLVNLFIFKKPIISLSYTHATTSTIYPENFGAFDKRDTKKTNFIIKFIKTLKKINFKIIFRQLLP